MAWYNASWNYRIKITVDHTKVGASLTNFPVYLDLSTLPAAFFSNVRSDGGDIRMTESDGTTEVAREIVAIDTVGKTGEVHFNTPSLSNTVDTVFYIYYNNPSATDYAANATYGKYNVWDSNYKGVYHLGSVNDSTVNQNTLTNTNSVGFVTALINQAADFGTANTNKQLQIATDYGIGGNQSITIDFIHKLRTEIASSYWAFFHHSSNIGTNRYLQLIYEYNGGARRLRMDNANGTQSYYNVALGTTNAHYFSIVRDAANSLQSIVYMDGSAVITGNPQGTSGDSAQLFRLATDTVGYTSAYDDELRISNVVRSSTWLSTQYNNQNSSSTFYTIGGQEIQSTGGIHGTLSMMGVGN